MSTLYAYKRVCDSFRLQSSLASLKQETHAQRTYVEQAREYLHKLEAVSLGLSFPVQTGNPVVDVVLGDKLELARACGAEADISLVLPEAGGISCLDWCVIFANAMDNAIQACAEVEGERFIRMAGEGQGSFYMLEFENTCRPKAGLSMGTGLSNIKAVAEKYDGAMTFERTGSLFRLHVLLDISVQPEGISGQMP